MLPGSITVIGRIVLVLWVSQIQDFIHVNQDFLEFVRGSFIARHCSEYEIVWVIEVLRRFLRTFLNFRKPFFVAFMYPEGGCIHI